MNTMASQITSLAIVYSTVYFEVTLTFEIVTVSEQQHSFLTHERMLL